MDELEIGVLLADPYAIDEALAFLEADPFTFRSGYARCRIALRLAGAPLSQQQRARARALIVSSVDGSNHCPQPGIGRLARTVADNDLRRQVRARLHDPDLTVAHRSLRMLPCLPHPGLTPADLRAARELILQGLRGRQYLPPSYLRLARWAWGGDWARELQGLADQHGPDRAGARALLDRLGRRA